MNLKKIVLLLFISISTTSVFAQKDGYWDKERAFNKEIVVSARERIVVKTEDLPVGTTEVVFRITLLDQNQQMANSLVSTCSSAIFLFLPARWKVFSGFLSGRKLVLRYW
jgi:hypothetical protein